MEPFLVVITGQSHSGKTSLMQQFVDEAFRKKLQVAGILAPGKIEHGCRSGFDIVDLIQNKTYLLSQRCDPPGPDGVPYTFYDEGLAACRRALDPEVCKRADIIIIDEVEPIELNDKGWADQLTPLLEMPDRIFHIWVSNKDFFNHVCTKFGVVPRAVIDVSNKDAFDQLCSICIKQ